MRWKLLAKIILTPSRYKEDKIFVKFSKLEIDFQTLFYSTFLSVSRSLHIQETARPWSGFRADCIFLSARLSVITRIFSLDLNSRFSFPPIGELFTPRKNASSYVVAFCCASPSARRRKKSARVQGDASFSLQTLGVSSRRSGSTFVL